MAKAITTKTRSEDWKIDTTVSPVFSTTTLPDTQTQYYTILHQRVKPSKYKLSTTNQLFFVTNIAILKDIEIGFFYKSNVRLEIVLSWTI